MALQYATEALKVDREVVLEAVKENDMALQYASEALQGDREFLLEAVKDKLKSCSGHFTLMSSEAGTCVSVAPVRAHIDLDFFLNAEPQDAVRD